MAKIWLAAAAIAGLAVTATPAAAQRVWQNGRWVVMPGRTAPHVMPTSGNRIGHGHRWGPMVNGRWDAGYRAPGGWNAYHRLGRGAVLPGYWMGENFRVPDYLSYGLAAPPRGYYWVRYYDDAVLVDAGGHVWDSIDGIGWAGAEAYSDGGYASSESYSTATVGAGYAQPGIQPVDPDVYYDDAPPLDAPMPYPAPGPAYAPPPPPPPVQVQTYPAPCQQRCGGAYYGGTFYGGSAQQAGSYYASSGASYAYGAGGTTTTVVIMPAPVTTTTVVEERVVEERVVSKSYVRAAPRKVVRRYHPKPKVVCGCR